MTFAVIGGAAVVTALVLTAAAILIGRPTGGHATRGPWLRPLLAALKATPGPHRALRLTWLRDEDLTDEDKKTELWVDGLVEQVPGTTFEQGEGVQHGPAAPARRPQVLTVARVRAAAIIRALPLDAVPHLRKGQYEDSTGTFTKLAQEPPALHADESFSMNPADLAKGLAEHAKDWTP